MLLLQKTKNRFTLLYGFFFSFLVISFFIRLFLMLVEINEVNFEFIILVKMLIIGLFYDLVTAFYFFIPLAIYLFLVPKRVYNTKIHRVVLYVITVFTLFIMLFNGVSEYFFWEEFGKRFNFIAVDYLVYTHEVIKNIQESYPLPLILSSILLFSLMIVFYFRDKLFVEMDNSGFLYRLKIIGIFLLISVVSFNLLDSQGLSKISNNIYNNELAKNGIYSLFSAFRHNELKYDEFYKTIPQHDVFDNLKRLENFDNNNPKVINFSQKEQRKNIILIMVESLSAEYMGIFGDTKHLTPNLDKLAKQSLFFDNFYATGTRTVRGMEAVNLSVPPTPGRSIVKRPKNDTLDSIGKILKAKNYDTKFIYAGHGYFDNMNDFFSKNGFTIVDRLSFDDDEITFSNVWGVCDENLLDKTISEADKSYKNHKPFFSFVMTTSNHRPYTYPDNKIDIPSHTGRDGAVKYTDFALGEFIKKVQTKPWFKDTIFVILADHNGGSAGKTSLPLFRYKIPLFIYAPNFIKPKVISKLSSQIDTMPTVFALMHLNYKAKFYGNNILDNNYTQRAFVGNYQKLGYVKKNNLYYLTPDKMIHKKHIQKLSLRDVIYQDTNITQQEEKDTITYYQSASYIYNEF